MKKILFTLSIVSLIAISTFILSSVFGSNIKNEKLLSNVKLIEKIDLLDIIKSGGDGKNIENRNSIVSNNLNNTINTFTNSTEVDVIIETGNIDNYIITETSPYISIVIDDSGNTLNRYEEYIELALKYDITFAIMPDAPHATKLDNICFENSVNTIIHMPMENRDAKYFGEKTIIKTYMNDEEISNLLSYSFSVLPHATGINNHTGSLATSDIDTVNSVVKFLKNRDKYFFDSVTTGSSVVSQVANDNHLPTAKRDIFLDNEDTYEAVLKQWKTLIRIAKQNGGAVAIGHYWSDNTFYILSNELPNIHKEGIITKSIKEVVR